MSERQDPASAAVGIFATPELAAARQKLDEAASRQTSTVTYVSAGHCLVIGAPEAALAAAARLLAAGVQGATAVHADPATVRVSKALTAGGGALFTVPTLRLGGHLGAFSAEGVAADGATTDLAVSMQCPGGRFDLVLDLSEAATLPARLSPPGYVHAGGAGPPTLDEAVETLTGLVGEFDKPRYFAYEASICAHSRSRLAGCSNCLDVCVTGAISSAGEGVVVDPYLCQGCGSCATLCPTGAMVYAYPKPSDAIARSREALAASGATTLVLHGEDAQAAADAAASGGDATLALLVEEVSAFGIDYWATILAAGVGRILVVSDAAADDPNRRALEGQATLLHQLLGGLGLGPEIVQIVPSTALVDVAALPGPAPALLGLADAGARGGPRGVRPAAFATHDDKRQTLRMAVDALSAALVDAPALAADLIEPLPPGSPFGHVLVDTDACTLCMACVSTCPAGALLDGQDTPALRLIEANCVQCGLCEKACPEGAITLESRWMRDGVAARRTRTLHAEAPFNCVVCHKAFATRTMIETVLGKLGGHWMFTDDKARRRLKMCEDCRVKDIFDADPGGLDVHAGPGEESEEGGTLDGSKVHRDDLDNR